MTRHDQALVLWDSESRPPETGSVYLWNGHEDFGGRHSLFAYCEANAERLRAKYGRWIQDLGDFSVDGKRVVEHLALEDGFSYWWMTRFVEQSPWKSPSINEAIRLLALDEILVERKPARFRLVSANPILDEVLADSCRRLGIDYEWERLRGESGRGFGLREAYRALPQPVRALASLARDLWVRWPLRRAPKPVWFDGEKSVLLCSYFMYMDPEQAKGGHFRSRYWEGLPGLMAKLGVSGNWLQLFRAHEAVPTGRDALDLTGGFNRNRGEEGFHAFLDSYLTWRIVLRVIKGWLHLMGVSRRLREIEAAFRPQGAQCSLWPLMRGDWYASMRGPDAVDNLLSLELFERALGDIPPQNKGLYLCENQAWERALIRAWRKHGHGRLIAVPHSTQSFWDLRYFRDSDAAPRPDLTAVNGSAARDTLIKGNHPREGIVECEALRYGYLNGLPPRRASSRAPGGAAKVLILGEYLPSGTVKMLKWLESAAAGLTAPAAYTVKPHPNYPVDPADYPGLALTVLQEPLGKILREFDVAYAGCMTSAAVDAAVAGLPVVVLLDETKLNFSPLRGVPGVRFVGAPEALPDALRAAARDGAGGVEKDDFFFLDPELPRWKKILLTP